MTLLLVLSLISFVIYAVFASAASSARRQAERFWAAHQLSPEIVAELEKMERDNGQTMPSQHVAELERLNKIYRTIARN